MVSLCSFELLIDKCFERLSSLSLCPVRIEKLQSSTDPLLEALDRGLLESVHLLLAYDHEIQASWHRHGCLHIADRARRSITTATAAIRIASV